MDGQQNGSRPSDTSDARVRNGASTTELLDDLDAVRTTIAAGQRGVLRLLAELDRR